MIASGWNSRNTLRRPSHRRGRPRYADLLARDLLPRRDALGQPGQDRRERVGAGLGVRPASQVVVDDVDLVPALENRIAVGQPRYPSPPRIRMRMGSFSKKRGVRGIVPVGGPPGSASGRSGEVRERLEHSVDVFGGVVVAEADPHGPSGIEQPEPLHHA